MRALLIGCAVALATLPDPASAVDPGQMAFTANPGVRIHSGWPDGRRGDSRRHRGSDGAFLYDRDYQGDTGWRSDGFNDWWHDRPERAYPRWMLGNQDCQRQWYAGSVLRC